MLANPNVPNQLSVVRVMNQIQEKLNKILVMLAHPPSKLMTARETAEHLRFSMSYLYKLTANNEIPHSKPNGKLLYFEMHEVDAWALGKRVSTQAELEGRHAIH